MHGLSTSAQHLGVSPPPFININSSANNLNCSAPVGGTALRRRSCPSVLAPLPARRATTQPHSRFYSSALFMAGGGASDGPPTYTSDSSIGCDGSVAVDALSPQMRTTTRSADVPNTVNYNGETLTFGDYRRPSIAERAAITLATFGAIAWKAVPLFRTRQRTWSKVAVAVVAPCLAWLVRSVMSYFYKEIVLQPKLRSPESVAYPNSRFRVIDGLKVHYLRETPKVEGEEVALRAVLHMNHGFGALSSSWIPVISQLSGALGAVTLAHDTPGFGLTDRPGLWRAGRYSLRSNAAITQAFVRDAREELSGASETESSSPQYIMMGHSMGCITAATAALDPALPPEDTTLVLVAPAVAPPSEPARSAGAADGGAGNLSEAAVRGGGGGGVLENRRRVGRVVGAVVGAPLSTVKAIGEAAAWVFNWFVLPLFYPLEILGLRALVYRGNFWRAALRLAWFDKSGVDVDVVNRYRWPSLVRYWDRGMALFLLDRAQIGQGGRTGPPGLVEAVAKKAAMGMKVIIVQGDKDTLVSVSKATAIADAIPESKLVVLRDCGHVPHEERPEDFLRLVLGQIAQVARQEESTTTTDVGALPP